MWTWTVHLKSSCFSKAATSFETKDYRKLFEPFLNLVPLLCSCDLYLYTFLWSLGIYTDFRRSFYVMTSYGRGETRTARGWREWYSSPYCNFYQNITDVWPKREKKGFFKVDQQRQFALFADPELVPRLRSMFEKRLEFSKEHGREEKGWVFLSLNAVPLIIPLVWAECLKHFSCVFLGDLSFFCFCFCFLFFF